GELIEQMETDEGFEISSFASQTHALTGDDLGELDVQEWVHQFFKDLDALEPGMRFMPLHARDTAASMSDAFGALVDDLDGWTYVLVD
ncbi:MAG: hypothetical protein JOZ57_07415, partial [Abitibacteriaceae bacterium]|nr:hypothetical protein [Abditibacteriaceae bacterium]